MDEESSEESADEVLVYSFSTPFHVLSAIQEEFYTPGTLELLETRRRLAEYSLPRLDFI